MSGPGSSSRPATSTRCGPRSTACTTTRTCAARSARTPARRSPSTPTTPGRKACRVRWMPASVDLPMRRTILLALFAALVLVLPTTAHAQSNETILRDCADDGILQGDYSASAMRTARNNMPAELDEYSDCRDVLSRAISAKTAGSNNNNSTNNNSGGTGTGGGTGGSTGTGGGTGGTGGGIAPSPTTAPQAAATPSGRDPG